MKISSIIADITSPPLQYSSYQLEAADHSATIVISCVAAVGVIALIIFLLAKTSKK